MQIVVEGVVVQGDHRGRTLGFPTANVELPHGVELPDDGVYAGYAERDDHTVHLAAISVGHRPTFYGEEAPRLLEAYLLDFDDNLYGERLVVTITDHIRGQLHFTTREQLIAQIATDVGSVRSLLEHDAVSEGT